MFQACAHVVAEGFVAGPPLSPGMWLGLSALELGEAYSREQRRAEAMKRQLETERQLGKDSAQIEALQKQLADQNAQLMQMQQKMNK